MQNTTEEVSSEPAEDRREEKHDNASAVEEQEPEVDRESAKEDR